MMQNDFETLIRLVVQKFDRGNARNWQNREFNDLSIAIQNKTKVSISVSTLKRIFGKVSTPNRYYPQKATLQALMNYSGYEFQHAPYKAMLNLLKIKAKRILFVILLMLTVFGILFFCKAF